MEPADETSDLKFLMTPDKIHPSDGVRDMVERLRNVKVQPFRKRAVKKFWDQLEDDLLEYEKTCV